jgi:hypothetical protein
MALIKWGIVYRDERRSRSVADSEHLEHELKLSKQPLPYATPRYAVIGRMHRMSDALLAGLGLS